MVVLSAPVTQALAEASIAHNSADPAEHERLVAVAMAVRDFSLGNDYASLPAGEDYRSAITADALAHLLDVRVVFVISVLASVVLFVVLLTLFIVSIKRKGSAIATGPLIIGGAIPLAAAAILAVAIAIDFNAFFVWLHGLFFAEGSWTFPADSLLIRALPYNFWVSCAVVWAASMALFCLINIVAGLLLQRRQAHRDSSLPK
jgi:integral membrane protein (TIGR01906 family)